MRGEAVEDYVKAIYALTGRGDARGERATLARAGTQEVAHRLGVSAASATRMLQRLSLTGLVEYEPYHGAGLTPEGERLALEVIRHHRLLELYLHRALGYSWDEVHDEAERLEHYISEDLEARIFEALGRPVLDPHGDVIPTAEGSLPEEGRLSAQRPLSELAAGERAVVRCVPSSDPAKLRYLGELGLAPGAALEVLEKYPFGGGLRLRVGTGEERVVGEELASEVMVIPAARGAEGPA